MIYNLTNKQKDLARWIVDEVRKGVFPESFTIDWFIGGCRIRESPSAYKHEELHERFGRGELDALAESKLLLISVWMSTFGGTSDPSEAGRQCTLTASAYRAVDTDFADDERSVTISTLAQPYPPEIAMSLDRLRAKYPDPKKLGFLVMRFTAAKPFARIVEIIKQTAAKYDVTVIRADENEFHADLWGNVRTHLHGCGFGIAVYERIETEEPNANVGLEVGYLMAMNKPVLLLKDKTVATLQADLAGKLYRPFDPHDPDATIPDQLTRWLEDNGIVVPKRT